MLRSRASRRLGAAVLAASASLGAFGYTSSAGASDASIKCNILSGNVTATVVLSACTGNSGGSSMAIPATVLVSGGTITWVNGRTTTVALTATAGEGSTPGVDGSLTIPIPVDPPNCAVGRTEFEVKGSVSADTTGSATVGSTIKLEDCVKNAGVNAGNVSLEGGTTAKI